MTTYLPHLLLFAFYTTTALAQTTPSWHSKLYPENWKPGYEDEQGHYFHDFSYAGYHQGTQPIPHKTDNVLDVTQPPFGADKTGATDATVAIQAALDKAATDGGGVVFLPAGTYRVAPQGANKFSLQLTGEHVVLRGEGTDKTFVFNDSLQMRDKNVIEIKPKNPIWWTTESYPAVKVTQDLLKPTFTIPVEDTQLAKVGDLILVRGDITQRLIDQLGMNGIWTAGAKYPSGIIYCRRVTAVDEANKTLTVDIPLRGMLYMADNARVTIPPKNGRLLAESGLEDFSISMKQHPGGKVDVDDDKKLPPGSPGYEMHRAAAVSFDSTENCWALRVNSYCPAGNDPNIHVQSHGMRLWRSRNVTLENCVFKFPQFRGEGGNGYMFTLYGNDCLIKDCAADGGRHNFSFGEMSANGNVILRFHSSNGRLPSDFHMFLSLANLIDSTVCDADFLQAIPRNNVKHGVTTTQSVYWNTEGLHYPNDYIYRDIPNKGVKILIQSEQWGDGYVIGTKGPAHDIKTTNFSEGIGEGETLVPQSLYEDQLKRRLETAGQEGKGIR